MAVYRRPGHVVFTGYDRREVEVRVDCRWHYGEQRSWDLAEDGTWSATVTWSAAPGENRIGRFPAEDLRLLVPVVPVEKVEQV
jgi:hypothetical protein